MSRIALLAASVFVVAGVASGQLIDTYGGAAGAVEWVLRTLVVISLAVALGGRARAGAARAAARVTASARLGG